jgi:mono/diheme cytochrome c family protein
MFRHLSDRDLGRLIAYLRTVPVTIEGETEKTEVRIVGRVLVAKGDFKPAAAAIPLLPAAVKDADDAIGRGRYLAMNFCSECHGQSLEGFAPIHAPPLEVVKGYSLEQFTRLMKEGMPVGDRELKLMGPTSRARFASFTPDEIAAVHTFLSTL